MPHLHPDRKPERRRQRRRVVAAQDGLLLLQKQLRLARGCTPRCSLDTPSRQALLYGISSGSENWTGSWLSIGGPRKQSGRKAETIHAALQAEVRALVETVVKNSRLLRCEMQQSA